MLIKPPWLEEKKKESQTKEWLRRVRHVMMLKYGWISTEDFKKEKMSTIFDLLLEIDRDLKEEKKASEKLKRKGK